MHPAVSLQDVSHRYGDTHALQNVTLSLPTGCTVGLGTRLAGSHLVV